MPDTMIQTAPPTTAMPVEIAKAIGEVMAQVKALPKGEYNQHSNYNFTSIDDFLAYIGPLCSTAGLIVLQDEDGAEVFDRGGKGWMKVTYSFTLAHTSGAVAGRPIRRTVLQAVTGPQTMGSSQSYALKQFLRSLFMVPTGDRDDADHQPKESMQVREKPQEAARQPRRTDPTPKGADRAPAAPADSRGPSRTPIPMGDDGLLIGRWTRTALEALAGKPEAWRREWLELHTDELAEVRRLKPPYADRIEGTAIAPDAPAQDAD